MGHCQWLWTASVGRETRTCALEISLKFLNEKSGMFPNQKLNILSMVSFWLKTAHFQVFIITMLQKSLPCANLSLSDWFFFRVKLLEAS